jgi:SMODS and SLOG-associating 2TM effector domain 3/SMODS and SLOG-associating 2TM effector domain 1
MVDENINDDLGADLELPAILASADQSSFRSQKWFLVLTATSLGLVAVAASMGAVDQTWAGWVGAAAFLGAFVLGSLAITQNLERTWYDGRAVAESAKSLAWLYAVRGGPFGDTGTDAEQSYQRRLRSVREELLALDFALPHSGVEITPSMRALREAPLATRRESYTRYRILDQIGYYKRRSADHIRQARRFRIATAAAQAVGLTGAILKALALTSVDLLGVGAACAAALTAWLQTRDHVTLARAYEITAQDLDQVMRDGPPRDDEDAWRDYVADAESAMSREHVMWIARRGRVRRGVQHDGDPTGSPDR